MNYVVPSALALLVSAFPGIALASGGGHGAQPHIGLPASPVLLSILLGMIVAMGVTEPILKTGFVKSRLSKGLHARLLSLGDAERIGIIFGIIGLVALVTLFSFSDALHVLGAIDHHAAVLVGGMMFICLHLSPFVKLVLARLQNWARRKDGTINEARFNMAAFVLVGIAGSFISEAAAAASATTTLALINSHQRPEVQKKLMVLLAAIVGIGGGLLNMGAPAMATGTNAWGWGPGETFIYMAPGVLASVALLAWMVRGATEQTQDAKAIEVDPITPIDWMNLGMWVLFLFVGVLARDNVFGLLSDANSISGMVAIAFATWVMNWIDTSTADEEEKHAAAHRLSHRWQHSLIFTCFMFGIMICGDMNSAFIDMFALTLPQETMARSFALYAAIDMGSPWMDNALAVFGLRDVAMTTPEMVAEGKGALDGGILTQIGNPPNLVVMGLWFMVTKVKASFAEWIKIALIPWIGVTIIGLLHVILSVMLYG